MNNIRNVNANDNNNNDDNGNHIYIYIYVYTHITIILHYVILYNSAPQGLMPEFTLEVLEEEEAITYCSYDHNMTQI